MHALPEKTREVVYLRLSGELPFSEIGAILGESETWARVTFYRAKQKLLEGGGV
ncbi:RNA polymerase sigma factor [Dysosmobacter sp.]|uniref:RNA polymerase sigma factor n=1 Tax=Dysosmobacter sp. TaxID=2591382 RepID=UPI003AEF6AD7